MKVAFDPLTHTYTMDGEPVLSVTQLCEQAGLVDKTFFTEEARQRGTDVHECLAAMIECEISEREFDAGGGQLVDAQLLERIGHVPIPADFAEISKRLMAESKRKFKVAEPYLQQWERFKKRTKLIVLKSEAIVHSRRHRYCGTLDIFGVLNGKRCVIDIKTGACKWIKEQLGLYSLACREMGLPVHSLFCLELTPKKCNLKAYDRTDCESKGVAMLKKAMVAV